MSNPTEKPIGDINAAYVGAIFLVATLVFGCGVGGLLVFLLMKLA